MISGSSSLREGPGDDRDPSRGVASDRRGPSGTDCPWQHLCERHHAHERSTSRAAAFGVAGGIHARRRRCAEQSPRTTAAPSGAASFCGGRRDLGDRLRSIGRTRLATVVEHRVVHRLSSSLRCSWRWWRIWLRADAAAVRAPPAYERSIHARPLKTRTRDVVDRCVIVPREISTASAAMSGDGCRARAQPARRCRRNR
jgi:hypothetical protein